MTAERRGHSPNNQPSSPLLRAEGAPIAWVCEAGSTDPQHGDLQGTLVQSWPPAHPPALCVQQVCPEAVGGHEGFSPGTVTVLADKE